MNHNNAAKASAPTANESSSRSSVGRAPHYLSRAGRAEPAKPTSIPPKLGVLPSSEELLARAQARAAAMVVGARKPQPLSTTSWARHAQAKVCPDCDGAGLHRRSCTQFQERATVPPVVARRFKRGISAMAWAGLQDARAGVPL